MSAELVAFLSRHIEVSEALAAVLLKSELVRSFPKGSFLLREGEVAKWAYFILHGCVRSYILKDGEDRTVDFFIEEDAVLPLGYGKAVPSEHFLECLEDTVAIVSSPDQEERMLVEHPELKEVCLAMSEVMAEKLQPILPGTALRHPRSAMWIWPRGALIYCRGFPNIRSRVTLGSSLSP